MHAWLLSGFPVLLLFIFLLQLFLDSFLFPLLLFLFFLQNDIFFLMLPDSIDIVIFVELSELLEFIFLFFERRKYDLGLILVLHLLVQPFLSSQRLELFLELFLNVEQLLVLGFSFSYTFFNCSSLLFSLLLLLKHPHLVLSIFGLFLAPGCLLSRLLMPFSHLCPLPLHLFDFLLVLLLAENLLDLNIQARLLLALLAVPFELIIQVLYFFLHNLSLVLQLLLSLLLVRQPGGWLVGFRDGQRSLSPKKNTSGRWMTPYRTCLSTEVLELPMTRPATRSEAELGSRFMRYLWICYRLRASTISLSRARRSSSLSGCLASALVEGFLAPR